jgi:hypothetical protein
MKLKILIYFVFLFFLVGILVGQQFLVFTQSGLNLEWEQHWDTYEVGGTCNFGTYNFFVGDVDKDETLELITGGLSYDMANYSRTDLRAPFKIWNWDGESFNLEISQEWSGVTGSTFAADLDQNGLPEIITGGTLYNDTGSYSIIRVWNWDGSNLILRSQFEGVSTRSISFFDVDSDGISEIITAGVRVEGSKSYAQLSGLKWEGDGIILVDSVDWCASNDASATSVVVSDLDNDGIAEIITGGYDNDLVNSSGQIRIWRWEAGAFSLIDDVQWRMVENAHGSTITGDPMGNTIVNNLRVGDVDSDGVNEIVSGGFTFDNEKIIAQLAIWNWDGQSFSLEVSQEWITDDITEVKSVVLDDVDGDSRIDVITAGLVGAYGGFGDIDVPPEQAQIRVWSWNGEDIQLKNNEEWTIGEGVVAWNVQTGDVDKDGTVEIITVGCMYFSALCDPDLRIWSVAADSSNLYLPIAAIGLISIFFVAVFLIKQRKNKGNKN